jgi:hypothetical protein
MEKFQKIYNEIKNELSFSSFNNIFSESTKVFDLEPCDVLHPIKRILIDKDGHDNIFSDDYIVNESKFGFDERFAEWISSLKCPTIIDKSDIIQKVEPTWKYYHLLKNSENTKPLIVAIFNWKSKFEIEDLWKSILRDLKIYSNVDKIIENKLQFYLTNKAGGLLERYNSFDVLAINKAYLNNTLIIHEFTHYIQDILNIFIDKSEEEKLKKLKMNLTFAEKEKLTKSFELKTYTIDELIDQFFSALENDVYLNSHVQIMLSKMIKELNLSCEDIIEKIETYYYDKTYSEQWNLIGFTKYDKIALLFLLLCCHFDMFWNKIKIWIKEEFEN